MFGLAVAIMLGAGVLGAGAGEAPLSFPAALDEAAASGPVQAWDRAVVARRGLDAALSPFTANPTVMLQGGRRAPNDAAAGPEAELWLSQSFHPGGYGAARRASVTAEAKALALEAEDVRLMAKLQAAEAWLSVWVADTQLAAAKAEEDVARALIERAEKAASLGGAIALDVEEARYYASEAALARLDAEGMRFEAGLALGRALGRTEPGEIAIAPSLPAIPKLVSPPASELVVRARKLPAVAAKFAEVDAEAARAVELEAQRGLALTLGAAVTWDPGGPGGLFSAGVTLPTFDRGERERAPVVALREKRAGEAAAELARALGELSRALHEVEHTQEIAEEYGERSLPALEKRVELRERLRDRGEGSVLELLRARRELVAGRGALEAAKARHVAAAWAWALLEQSGGR